VLRCDPQRKGLLYAGTNRGVYVSFDDGARWQPLSLNFPTTWVRDLLVHGEDLIAGTQGRGIWVLDDLQPLRQLNGSALKERAFLFRPAQAWRLRGNENHDTPPPPSTPLGQNPPTGAVVDYWLNDPVNTAISLIISDSSGKIIRQFKSDDKPEQLNANQYFQQEWLGDFDRLSSSPGMHRFVWDLRYPRPSALGYSYSIAAVWREGTPVSPDGPLVLPGVYSVTLEVDGKKLSQPLTVKLDPRVKVSEESLHKQLELSRALVSELGRAVAAHNMIENVLKEKKDAISASVVDSLTSLSKGGNPNLGTVAGALSELIGAVQGADAAPTSGQREAFSEYRRQLNTLLERWKAIRASIAK
jgi:hypothetical protein